MIQQFHSGYISKGNEVTVSKRYHTTSMLTAALFTIIKTWKDLKSPSMDEWIKKMKYICMDTIECYSAIEKKEILSFVTTWVTVRELC